MYQYQSKPVPILNLQYGVGKLWGGTYYYSHGKTGSNGN